MNRYDDADYEDVPDGVTELEPYNEQEIDDLFNEWEQERQAPRRSWSRR